jgi:hypothetical protein
MGTGEGGWQYCNLERLGLPMYFSAEQGGIAFMDGAADAKFTDNEIIELFKGTVALAGETAARLQARGFSEYLGVKVENWQGKNISGELLHINGNEVPSQFLARKLTPIGDPAKTEELSYAYHVPDGKTKEHLFPAVVRFENPVGGTTIVFCGTPKAELLHTIGFSFLNAARKEQFVSLLKKAGALPVYYPDDAEVYLRTGKLPDGKRVIAVFNIGLDTLEELPLVFDGKELPLKKVCKINNQGDYEDCEFSYVSAEGELGAEGTVFVKTEIRPMNPEVFVVGV